MARIDDWNMLCEAYKKADEEEKSTWHAILEKYHAVGSGASVENPTEAEITLHLNARLMLTAVRTRMDAFIAGFVGEE